MIIFLLQCFVEFTSEIIWPWSFLYGESFKQKFNYIEIYTELLCFFLNEL